MYIEVLGALAQSSFLVIIKPQVYILLLLAKTGTLEFLVILCNVFKEQMKPKYYANNEPVVLSKHKALKIESNLSNI